MLAGLGIVLCALLLLIGVERRNQAIESDIVRVGEAEMVVYERVLGPAARRAVGTPFPPERRLVAEMRRLEETRSGRAPVPETVDCARVLSSLLACWPADVNVITRSIVVAPKAITVQRPGGGPLRRETFMGSQASIVRCVQGRTPWYALEMAQLGRDYTLCRPRFMEPMKSGRP